MISNYTIRIGITFILTCAFIWGYIFTIEFVNGHKVFYC